MTIKLLTDRPYRRADNNGEVTIPAGSVVSVFDAATEAAMIVAKTGAASAGPVTWVPPSEVSDYRDVLQASEVEAVQALVSEAGTITAAALLTTTGTLGQVVRLSDGADKGAILMWSTPASSSTPQWCWWLWPQSPYI